MKMRKSGWSIFLIASVLWGASVGGLAVGAAHAAVLYVYDYLIIATGDSTGDNDVGNALSMQDSEIGAISAESSGPLRFNAVSPPQGNPAFPAGTQGPSTGIITLDGDAAITSASGKVTLSNSDVHALNTGSASAGSQGIDCANSFNGCTVNGSQITTSGTFGAAQSGSGFNQTPLPAGPSFSQIADQNGIQGGVDFSSLLAALAEQSDDYWDLAATDTWVTQGLNNQTATYTFGSGLHVIDIDTNGSDFDLSNSNWVVDGEPDTYVIFRINPESKFNASNSNLLLGGDMGLNNILFLVDAKSGDGSFGFNNVEFYGYSFWDYLGIGLKNEAVWNNVRGCGQVITDKVNFNNVSMIGCAYTPEENGGGEPPAAVLEPGTLALLGLGLLGIRASRRRNRAVAA